MSETVILPLSDIVTEGGTQMRAGLKKETVEEYAELYREGAILPPVVVYHDGEKHWLGDGFHRVEGKRRQGGETIEAVIHAGTRRDALLFAAGANAAHGLRRTDADKRLAVETLLRDEEWSQWSDHEIARRAGVTHPFVGKIRKQLSGNHYQMGKRKAQRKGTEYDIDSTNIGKHAEPEAAPETTPGVAAIEAVPESAEPKTQDTVIQGDEGQQETRQQLAATKCSVVEQEAELPNRGAEVAEVRENLAELGQRLAGPALEWPTEEEEPEEEPPWTPAPADPKPWLWVPVAGKEGSAVWVPDWPEEGTDAERSEWAGGFAARLRKEEGLEALAEIARQSLAELLIEGRAETVRSVMSDN